MTFRFVLPALGLAALAAARAQISAAPGCRAPRVRPLGAQATVIGQDLRAFARCTTPFASARTETITAGFEAAARGACVE